MRTHVTHPSLGVIWVPTQSFADTVLFLLQQQAVIQKNRDRGETEPRVENLCRRFSGSARQFLSAEKLRHELLFSVHTMLPDTRVPAFCICDIPQFGCSSSSARTVYCWVAATIRLHTSHASAVSGSAPRHTSPSRTSIPSCFSSKRVVRPFYLLLLTAGVCPGSARPAVAAITPTFLGVPAAAAELPHTKIAKRAYKRALARAVVPGQGGTNYRGRWQTLRQLLPATVAARPRRRLSAESTTGPHVRYLTNNCGGLSSDVYQELLLTLGHILSRSRKLTGADSASEYTTGFWRVVSSHRNDYKAAGVPVLVQMLSWLTPSHTQVEFYIFASRISLGP